MAQRILGLDLGFSAIKGVVLETSLRAFQMVAFHGEPITVAPNADPEVLRTAQRSALLNLLEKVGHVDQVIVALPGPQQACSAIEMPFSDATKIQQTLAFQLDDITPFELEDLLYDYQFIERNKKGPSRLLVGTTPRSQVANLLDILQSVQIDPRILMMDGLPYFHLFGPIVPLPLERAWAVLDIGESHTTLTVFRNVAEEPQEPVRVELVRTINRGIKHIKQALQNAFAFSSEDAHAWIFEHINLAPESSMTDPRVLDVTSRAFAPIISELRRTLASIQHRQTIAPERILLTGGGSAIPGICAALTHRLAINTEILSISNLPAKEDLSLPDPPSSYLKALGLALRSMRNSRYAHINLRQKEFSFKGDLQFLKERVRPIIFGSLILLILFIASVVTQFYVRSVEHQRLSDEIESRCRKIIGRSGLTPQRCLRIMRDEIQKVQGGSQNTLLPRISARDVFFEIYDRVARLAKTRNIKVVVTSWRITNEQFDIEGETESFAAVGQIEQELSTYRCFQDLRKGKIQRREDGRINFSLRAKISC